MGAVLPGYVIHATALDNVLQGDPISRVTTRTRRGDRAGARRGVRCAGGAALGASRSRLVAAVGIA